MNSKDKVLKWANRIRKEVFHKKPLKRLPRGVMEDGQSCVIHNCFAAAYDRDILVDPERTLIYGDSFMTDIIHHPLYIQKFISDFDGGEYPELEIK